MTGRWPTVLHLHVPRTGGISVGRALTAALGTREIVRTHKRSDLAAAIERGADIGLVSGHYPWGLHELLPDHVYFIVVRDPVERVLSLYNFVRSVPVHPRHKLFSAHTLEDLLKRPMLRRFFSNGQVRQIGAWQRGAEPLGPPVMARAWEHLCQDDVVVTLTDRIDDGLLRLGQRIGMPIPPHRKSMNSAPRTSIATSVLEDIRSLNELDAELYRRARERFGPTQSAELGPASNLRPPSPGLMDNLRRLVGLNRTV